MPLRALAITEPRKATAACRLIRTQVNIEKSLRENEPIGKNEPHTCGAPQKDVLI
jgi:hypothetical protein